MRLRDAGLRGAERPSLRPSLRTVGAVLSGLVVVAGATIAFGAASLVQGSPPPTETLSCNDDWTGAGATADWASAANWTAGVPNGPSVNACVAGDAAVLLPHGSFSIGELTVSAGSSLAVTTTASLSVSSGLQNDGALTVDAATVAGTTVTPGQPGLVLDGAITNTGTITVDGLLAIGSTAGTTGTTGTATSETSGLANDGTVGVAAGGQIAMAEAATMTNEPDGVLAFGIDGPPSSVADYGRITNGTLSLAGSADPVYENGFTPSPGTEYFVDSGEVQRDVHVRAARRHGRRQPPR